MFPSINTFNTLNRPAPNPLKLDRVFATPSEDVVATRILDDEVLVLNRSNGECLRLTRMGTQLWELLHEVKALQEVLGALLEDCDLSQEQLTANVADVLTELESRGLLQVHSSNIS